MTCDKRDLLLYAVTDRSWLNGGTLYRQMEMAVKGGATVIPLREKTGWGRIKSLACPPIRSKKPCGQKRTARIILALELCFLPGLKRM